MRCVPASPSPPALSLTTSICFIPSSRHIYSNATRCIPLCSAKKTQNTFFRPPIPPSYIQAALPYHDCSMGKTTPPQAHRLFPPGIDVTSNGYAKKCKKKMQKKEECHGCQRCRCQISTGFARSNDQKKIEKYAKRPPPCSP